MAGVVGTESGMEVTSLGWWVNTILNWTVQGKGIGNSLIRHVYHNTIHLPW